MMHDGSLRNVQAIHRWSLTIAGAALSVAVMCIVVDATTAINIPFRLELAFLIAALLVLLVESVYFTVNPPVRNDGETRCAHCEYPVLDISDRARCPECGHGLSEPGALVPGFRRKRWPFAAVAAVILLVLGFLTFYLFLKPPG
jgi:hypothetical protein